MFGFIDMINTRDFRVVANDEINGAVIDTCRVTDSDSPYETGIRSKYYNNGMWVIVEMYDDIESAKIGHSKWVKEFSGKRPEKLKDVSTSFCKKVLDLI